MLEGLGAKFPSISGGRLVLNQPGRGSIKLKTKHARTPNTTMIDVQAFYRLSKAVRRIDANQVPQFMWSHQSVLLSGQAMADWYAQYLNDRGRRVVFDWSTLLQRTMDAVPPLTPAQKQWMHRAVRLPSFQVWRKRFTSYNMNSAYGPNLATNAHLRVASEDDLRRIYDGLVEQAMGREPLTKEQLLAFIRLLFKSKDPLIGERWRTLVLQSVDFKWIEDLLFFGARMPIDHWAPPDICGFREYFGIRFAIDKVHAIIDSLRMLLKSAIFLTFDVRKAFPSLDLMVALLSYRCIGMPDWWLSARARLWGMSQWNLETGEFKIDADIQPRGLLTLPGCEPRVVRQDRGVGEGTRAGTTASLGFGQKTQ
jgi:hypothetical protein